MVPEHIKSPDMNLTASDWTIERKMKSTKIELGAMILKLNTSIPKRNVKQIFS